MGLTTLQPNWRYEVKFANSGQTLAYGFRQFTTCTVLDEPVSETKFWIGRKGPISRAPLPAGATVSTTGTYPMTAEETTDIRVGRKSFYVYGEIDYTDAFRRQRRVRFRFMHGQHNRPEDLVYCETGNDEI